MRPDPHRSPRRTTNLSGGLRFGDEAALAAVYDRDAPAVLATARRVCADAHAAEDVSRRVFLRLWHQVEAFDGAKGTLRGWLLLLSHRRAVDWLRREVTRRLVAAGWGPTPVPSAEDEALAIAVRERVSLEVDHLPPTYREVVRMLYYEGLTVREIAVRLGIPEGLPRRGCGSPGNDWPRPCSWPGW